MKKCLVIGNGRAGKRHVKSAQACGLQVVTVDPYQPADLTDWRVALQDVSWDYVVLASPPANHAEQLLHCIALDIPTLCEKPLTGGWNDYSVLPDEARVLVAYNWLYNQSVKLFAQEHSTVTDHHMFCEQARALPAWGLLLDHVGHDFSIMDYVSGGICEITWAARTKNADMESWTIFGVSRAGKFSIVECVWQPAHTINRVAAINNVPLLADQRMFSEMWQAFLAGRYEPGLRKGKQIQGWLQDTLRCSNYEEGMNG